MFSLNEDLTIYLALSDERVSLRHEMKTQTNNLKSCTVGIYLFLVVLGLNRREAMEVNSNVSSGESIKVKVQKFGGRLSAMVMPNIGAFIAWGLVTALFIPTGWFPNETLGELVGPTIKYLLPLLIAYTGGYNLYGLRGGVAGATATMGLIIGSELTMLIGAMAMGPFAAWTVKRFDKLIAGKVKPGLEMLVDNFSLGIIVGILMVLGMLIVEPIFSSILAVLSGGISWFVSHKMIPFTSIFIEPAEVLFLNNAVNHGILVPLGIEQATELGKSILFLVEANTGPRVGVLLAFCLFGKGIAKKTAPGASIIVMIGGIGEVYFPYVLMKPILLIATILGSMVSLFIFQTFNGGLIGVPSPGSIIAIMLMSPKGAAIVNFLGYFIGMFVAFLVASFILKRDKTPEEAVVTSEVSTGSAAVAEQVKLTEQSINRQINKVLVVCDGGMGSSAMGSAILKNKINKAKLNLEVKHASIGNIPSGYDLMITHQDLLARAKEATQREQMYYLTIQNFLDEEEYNVIVKNIIELNSQANDG